VRPSPVFRKFMAAEAAPFMAAGDGTRLGLRHLKRALRRELPVRDGRFDRLVRRVACGLDAALVTFDRHPAQVVRPDSAPKLLSSLDQKLELRCKLIRIGDVELPQQLLPARALRCEVQHGRRLRCGCGHDNRVPHRSGFGQGLHHLRNRRSLLPDRVVNANQVIALAVNDGVERNCRLAGLTVTDDELTLTTNGSQLVRFAPAEVADAYCCSRLGTSYDGTFGTLGSPVTDLVATAAEKGNWPRVLHADAEKGGPVKTALRHRVKLALGHTRHRRAAERKEAGQIDYTATSSLDRRLTRSY